MPFPALSAAHFTQTGSMFDTPACEETYTPAYAAFQGPPFPSSSFPAWRRQPVLNFSLQRSRVLPMNVLASTRRTYTYKNIIHNVLLLPLVTCAKCTSILYSPCFLIIQFHHVLSCRKPAEHTHGLFQNRVRQVAKRLVLAFSMLRVLRMNCQGYVPHKHVRRIELFTISRHCAPSIPSLFTDLNRQRRN